MVLSPSLCNLVKDYHRFHTIWLSELGWWRIDYSRTFRFRRLIKIFFSMTFYELYITCFVCDAKFWYVFILLLFYMPIKISHLIYISTILNVIIYKKWLSVNNFLNKNLTETIHTVRPLNERDLMVDLTVGTALVYILIFPSHILKAILKKFNTTIYN